MKRTGVVIYKLMVLGVALFILSGALSLAAASGGSGAGTVSRPVSIKNLSDEGGFFVLTFQETIHPSLPEFSFDIIAAPVKRGAEVESRRIIITETADKSVVQEISLAKLNSAADYPRTSDKETVGFVIEDMNFDGYKDIRIVAFMPGGTRIPYFYWFWDNEEGKFIRNRDLEQITSPVFDPVNKTIRSSAHLAGMPSYDIVYKYVNSVPVTKENYLKNLSYLDQMESSLKNQAESKNKKILNDCYKGWNKELNDISNLMLKEAPPEVRETLKAEQKKWTLEREKSAKAAGKTYTYSLLELTKNKTLELIDIFFGEKHPTD